MRSIRFSVIVIFSALAWCVSSTQAAGIPWNNPSGSSPGFFSWENGSNATGLFGDPIPVGNSLVFFPVGFKAQSANGVADIKSDQISVDITAAGNLNLTQIQVFELGDYAILGAGPNTRAQVSGTLVVTPLISNPGVLPGFDPLHVNPAMPVTAGAAPWNGNATVNYTVQNGVKKIHLTLDNIVQANSDPGTSSFIEKKLTQGIIIVIPEPATFGLVLCGAPLLLRRRRGQ